MPYEEEAVRILDRSMKTLRHKDVPMVKVLWSWQGVEEAMWEREDNMRSLPQAVYFRWRCLEVDVSPLLFLSALRVACQLPLSEFMYEIFLSGGRL